MIGDNESRETKTSLHDAKGVTNHQRCSLTQSVEAFTREPIVETTDGEITTDEVRQTREEFVEYKAMAAAIVVDSQAMISSSSCDESAILKQECMSPETVDGAFDRGQTGDGFYASVQLRETSDGAAEENSISANSANELTVAASLASHWKKGTIETSDGGDSCGPPSPNHPPSPTQPPLPNPSGRRTTDILLERIQNERKRSQARVDVIKKLRSLKARSEHTKSTHESSAPSVEGNTGHSGIVSVDSNDVSESNSSISTQTKSIPVHTVMLDSSSSHYREAAAFERDRANTFLVELAKAKAEILRLKFQEAAMEKRNRIRLHQEEKYLKERRPSNETEPTASLPSSWSRFWKLSNHRSSTDDSSPPTNSADAGKPLIIPVSDDETCETDPAQKNGKIEPAHLPKALPQQATTDHNTHSNRTIEENQALLRQLMQVMSSLSVRTNLSLRLDLKPSSHGWSLDSATVKRPDE